jgi:hypothetical protein
MLLIALLFTQTLWAAETQVYRFDWYDSRKPGSNTVIVNDCILEIPVNKNKDWCYINKRFLHECDVDLLLGDNCEKK